MNPFQADALWNEPLWQTHRPNNYPTRQTLWNEETSGQMYRPNDYPTQPQTLWHEEASGQMYRPNYFPTQQQTLWNEETLGQMYRPNDYPTQPQTFLNEETSPPTPLIPQTLPIFDLSIAKRRVLTSDERKKVCQYHEDNPLVKQAEIGRKFGVERSTISKILRNNLRHRSGSLPLAKPAKRKSHNIGRALKRGRGVDSLPSPASSKIMSAEEVEVNIHSAAPLSGLGPGDSTAGLPPTRDEARDALNTVLLFSRQESASIMDETDYACILNLLDRLQ